MQDNLKFASFSSPADFGRMLPLRDSTPVPTQRVPLLYYSEISISALIVHKALSKPKYTNFFFFGGGGGGGGGGGAGRPKNAINRSKFSKTAKKRLFVPLFQNLPAAQKILLK